jgi:hypothetical protein
MLVKILNQIKLDNAQSVSVTKQYANNANNGSTVPKQRINNSLMARREIQEDSEVRGEDKIIFCALWIMGHWNGDINILSEKVFFE